jgi:ectoine hydroxylase-related dioxygenase (phytanoyl-CoA dioxygenase family)
MSELVGGVPVYHPERLRDDDDQRAVEAELADALADGPGVLVIKQAVAAEAVDAATEVFRAIITEQHRAGTAAGDHYAAPGANDRIWNALEKLALASPEAFADYYSDDMIDLVSRAWLGPGYQITSQVNVVNPGGEAQQPHRDYHLGFMTESQAARYPRRAHLMAPTLTLQAAVAHGAIPVESGPTKLLPHSQKYGPGYLAWRRPEFVDYFEANQVQLALDSGDLLVFNPALFHAAGTNRTTDVARMANLLQVSSSMGRAMERIDRTAMVLALHPVLMARSAAPREAVDRVIAASAEGYPFPADLDREQPVDGLTPPTAAEHARRAIDEGWSVERLASVLGADGAASMGAAR